MTGLKTLGIGRVGLRARERALAIDRVNYPGIGPRKKRRPPIEGPKRSERSEGSDRGQPKEARPGLPVEDRKI